jgi:hypothetical protein
MATDHGAKVIANMQRVRELMIPQLMKIAKQAGHMVGTEAQAILTKKDFIVSGDLRRAKHVGDPVLVEGGDVIRVTVSFPRAHASWIEFGTRKDPRFGTVTMHNPRTRYVGRKGQRTGRGRRRKVFVHGEHGYLHEAMVAKSEAVHEFMVQSAHNALLGLNARMQR